MFILWRPKHGFFGIPSKELSTSRSEPQPRVGVSSAADVSLFSFSGGTVFAKPLLGRMCEGIERKEKGVGRWKDRGAFPPLLPWGKTLMADASRRNFQTCAHHEAAPWPDRREGQGRRMVKACGWLTRPTFSRL